MRSVKPVVIILAVLIGFLIFHSTQMESWRSGQSEAPVAEQIAEDERRARDEEAHRKEMEELAQFKYEPIEDIEIHTLYNGVQYQDIKVGTGRIISANDKIVLNYTGWTEEGVTFDSTNLPGKSPMQITFGKKQVIEGMESGLAGMKVGGMRRIIIPSELAYGERGSPPRIAPNEDIIFDVELIRAFR